MREAAQTPKIKRPVVSDLDGTQQGGLVFVISVIVGMMIAASIVPGALTSFWVWCALLALSAALGRGAQALFSRHDPEADT